MKFDLNTLAARRAERAMADIIEKLWLAFDRQREAIDEIEIALRCADVFPISAYHLERIADNLAAAARFTREAAKALER